VPCLPAGGELMFEAAQPYMQSHDPDEIPFLCLAGVREYHEHPAHSGDVWELYRKSGAGRLVRLLEIVDRYGVAPMTGLNVQLVPQVGFTAARGNNQRCSIWTEPELRQGMSVKRGRPRGR